MERPPRLYKFQPYTTQTLENLRLCQVWCSAPARFNDPYDCAVTVAAPELREEDLARAFEDLRRRAKDPAAFQKLYSENGTFNDRFREETAKRFAEAFARRQEELLHRRGFCCLSAAADDLLLWSHYAGGHRGLALEFDAQARPFREARPVVYDEAHPLVDAAALLAEGQDEDALQVLALTKSRCWSYEREWRIPVPRADAPLRYPAAALTGVYFGAAMPTRQAEIVMLVLRDRPTRFYRMRRSATRFALEVEPIASPAG